MMLIAFDVGGSTAVMTYLADDRSFAAISAEIAKAGFGAPIWRVITQGEADAIRSARAKPVSAPPTSAPSSDLDALKSDHEALKETVRQIIANTHLTDVHKF